MVFPMSLHSIGVLSAVVVYVARMILSLSYLYML